MSNAISMERNSSLFTSVASSNDKSSEIVAQNDVPASSQDVSLDDVIARLNSKAGADSRSELLQSMGPLSAPQLRKPDTAQADKKASEPDRVSGLAANRTPDGLDGAAALSYWVAKIQKVASETSDQQLVDSMERFKKTNEVQRKSFEKQADEAQKKEETAAVVSEVMGCVGKVLGGLLVAASVASAVFTGGTSLALAGVGLALMAADEITEAATGESLTGRLLSPLMDSVFSPLVQAFSGVVSDVLKKFGVSEDVSQIIGAVVGSMLAIMAVIAVAVATKSAAASNAVNKITGPLMRSLTKAMPQMMKSVAAKSSAIVASLTSRMNQVSQALTKASASGSSKFLSKIGLGNFDPKVFSLYAQMGAVGAGTARGASDAGTSAWLGVNQKQLAEITAEMTRLLTSMPQLERIIDGAVKEWQNQNARMTSLQKTASDAAETDHQTSLFTLRNTRRMAV